LVRRLSNAVAALTGGREVQALFGVVVDGFFAG
jgi:hypothetical protein